MFKKLRCPCEIVKNFSPSWFASVMGTGIVAITSRFYSAYIPFLKGFSVFLLYFNILLFFILLVPWILRWFMFRKNALVDLEHPVLSNFYPTISIALLVLSSDFILIGKNISLAKILWIVGAIFTIFFSILVPFIMFKSESVKLDHINPGWFIPPVGLIVIPIAGSILINSFQGVARELVIFVNYFSFSSGFFIYVALLAVCMYRFILHHPLPNVLAPTIWINLGPIGAGTLAFVNLIKNSPFIQNKATILSLSTIFWGFGIWWVLMAITMTIYYIRKVKLPYALTWWAFIFPLGAYTGATHVVSMLTGIKIIDHIGFTLYLLLLFMWTITLITTAIKTYEGTTFLR